MGVRERRAREREDLRQEILDAARDLFICEGYESVSMRKIADRIEYSPTTIYLYFRDKSELFDRLSEQAFGKLLEKLQSIGDPQSGDPMDRLRRGLCAYAEFGLENPDHYQITFMTMNARIPDAQVNRRHEVGCQSFGCLKQTVSSCIEAGLLRVDDIDLASQILWAGVHGITSLLIAKPSFPWVDKKKLISETIDTMLEGLRK
jgi:AcrR family transcriptional regulator